jgi:hypothetical protein
MSENPSNSGMGKRLMIILALCCAGLFLADFFYKKKTYLDIEDLPGFYPVYAFIGALALVAVARIVQAIVQRREDYYAPNDTVSEAYPADGLDKEDAHG